MMLSPRHQSVDDRHQRAHDRTGRMTAESMIAGLKAGTTRFVNPLVDTLIGKRPEQYIDLHFIPKILAYVSGVI